MLSTFALEAQKNKKNAEPQQLTEWNDVDIFEQNVRYPRANVIPYTNENNIESWKYETSANYFSLNGDWKVDIQGSINNRPDPESKTFSVDGWNQVEVPVYNIMDGGKVIKSPLVKNPNQLPSSGNTIVTYSRTFDAPKVWSEYTASLMIQARSACYVWLNGEYVGYCEDSRSFSEFRLDKHLKYGKTNQITVQVVSLSTGSLLEVSQDRSFLGITGDVAICLKPRTNVNDYAIVADFNTARGMGNFSLQATIENPDKKGQYYIEVEIWNPKGKQLDKMGKWVVFDKKSELTTTLESDFGNIKPWTAETPNLYTAVIRLRNEKMQLLETLGTRFAFRSVQVKDGILLVNGSPVNMRGVVYTGYDQSNGSIVRRDQMEKDIKMMKQNNINAVRTALYSPLSPRFYELCDLYGLYVVCDANLQPYSKQSKAVATDKDYIDHFVVRVQNMYERYKNHPSIIAWSLGSSRDNGICMESAYKALKQKDKYRPVIFAGAEYGDNTDLIASRGLEPDDLKAFAVKTQARPLILYSYGSTKGNNFGGVERLWQMVRTYRKVQGGFLDSWNSYRYRDEKSNMDASVSGLIQPNGTPVPYLDELRNIYRPFDVKMVALVPDHAEFNISNLLDFLSLKDYVLEYNIYSNLKPRIIEGEVDVDLAPGESKNFKLKVPKLTLYAGEELFIRFTIRQRGNINKAVPHGTELGTFEFPLPMSWVKKQPLPTYGREEIYVQKNPNNKVIHIFNNNVDLHFDLENANLTSFLVMDQEVLASAPRLNFWRPSTDNDLVDKNALRLWQNLQPENVKRQVIETNYRQIDKYSVGIDVMLRYTDKSDNILFDVRQSYAVLYTGDVLIDNKIMASEYVKALPKVGFQFEINKQFNQVNWLGLDKETYRDRRAAGLMGTYSQKADDLFFAYERPQASGNRSDVHWLSVGNGNIGLFVDMIDSTFDFSIYPYTDKQLSTITNTYDLKSQAFRTLNVDFRQSGIGSALAGFGIADEDVLTRKEYSFRLHLRGYKVGEAEPMDFRRLIYPVLESSVLPMPVIARSRDRFDQPMTISLSTSIDKAQIRYTVDGSSPDEKSPLYTHPFVISQSTVVQAKTFKKGQTASFAASERFNFDYITSNTFDRKPSTPYNYNMEGILFDGETGEISDLSQGWLGFKDDINVTFELSKSIELQDVVMHFAHVPDAWAFAPIQVMVYVSNDGQNWSEPIRAKIKYNPGEVEMNTPQLQTIKIAVDMPDVKYVRVFAKSLARIPEWHKAKNLKPWLMLDEVQLNEVIK